MTARQLAATILTGLWLVSLATAGDWPCWRGPERTSVSTEIGLLKQWPKEGPKLLWKAVGLGGGYSTPSVAGGLIFVIGSKGEDEFVMALDVKDGSLT